MYILQFWAKVCISVPRTRARRGGEDEGRWAAVAAAMLVLMLVTVTVMAAAVLPVVVLVTVTVMAAAVLPVLALGLVVAGSEVPHTRKNECWSHT